MENLSTSRRTQPSGFQSILVLIAASVSLILAAPRIGNPWFAWLNPFLLLYFSRVAILRRKWLWWLPVGIASFAAASYNVAPFPLAILLILSMIGCLKLTMILLLDRWITRHGKRAWVTLFFPAIAVANEYFDAVAGGGVWGSVANPQIHFPWFAQLASVTGIWGISFLIYWGASLAAWSLQKGVNLKSSKGMIIGYAACILLVLTFGAWRYEKVDSSERPSFRLAGISVPANHFLESLYRDFYGQTIQIPDNISLVSELMKKVQKAEMGFIESGDSLVYPHSYAEMIATQDSLFSLSSKAVDLGARLICWSEGSCVAFRSQDSALIRRGQIFARDHGIYLEMAMAVITPGKIDANTHFLENKALLLGPDGTILDIFHKNHPVPFAEASLPGDGTIPVIPTSLGRISPSICYDADFPPPMRQLSANRTDLLVLPSGDWHAINPYHTYMAIYRGIENGCMVFRQVSGGLSVVSDYRGKILGRFDYYKPGEKLWTADVAPAHQATVYGAIGDLFAYLCVSWAIFLPIWKLIGILLSRFRHRDLRRRAESLQVNASLH